MLDFKPKREGEPPARMLAAVQMKLSAAGLPKMFAALLAARMEDGDDLGDELIEELQTIVELFKQQGIEPKEAVAILERAFEDAADPGDDVEIENSWDAAGAKKARGLVGACVSQLREKGPSATKHKGFGPVRDLSPAAARSRQIDALADGLLSRMDSRHTPTIGRQYAGLSLGELVMTAEHLAGRRHPNMQEAVRMATHSSSDFPLVLENALGKSIGRRMEQTYPALARAAHELPAIDYRTGNLLRLSASGMPEEIGERGEIKYVTIDERGEAKPAPRDFGAMFALSQKAIVNDDLGMLSQINQQMASGAIERLRRVLLAPLLAGGGLGHTMADSKTVFHADHGNLAASGATITVTSLSEARLSLRGQRGSQGEYYAIEPWALVVPPALETTAQMVLAEINATVTSDVNPFSGKLELIVEPGLTSQTAWYMIGDPSKVDGLAYSFLDGQKTPKIESKPGWNTLGIEMRLVWALDARFVSYASWYQNPGA